MAVTAEPFNWWWWWELAGAALSLASICLIITILVLVGDKPLSAWPLSIQPNSAISILTTVAKATIMMMVASCISQLKWRHMQLQPQPLHHLQIFDDASRGPWGAAVMLFRVPLRLSSILGWALALITVAGLGIEPSAQNILDFQIKPVNLTNTTAEMYLARQYVSKAFRQEEYGNNLNRAVTSELPHFQAVVLNGMSGQVLPPSFVCPSPSVSCTWPSFTSLGICVTFRNVTEGVDRNCTNPDSNYRQSCRYHNISGWHEDDTKTGDRDQYRPTLNYTNPGDSSGLAQKTQTLYTTYGTTGGRFGGPWLILRHTSSSWPGGWGYYSPPWPEVFTANFAWCEQTYSGIGTADPVTSGRLVNGTVTSKPLFYRLGANDTLLGNQALGYSTADNSSTYHISYPAEMGLQEYLSSVLEMSAFDYLRSSSQMTGAAIDAAMNLNFVLKMAPDLEVVAQNLANTLTNLIRNSNDTGGGDNALATTVTGTAFGREQFVIVRWQWLILPVLETVLALVLLVISIVITSGSVDTVSVGSGVGEKWAQQQQQPQLKDSVSAYLLYPLSGWTEDEIKVGGRQTGGKLEDFAAGMKARFAMDDAGRWRFWRA
ncbi:Protein of unknown function (DUF3176) domain containing protein [Rhypophila decipiens]